MTYYYYWYDAPSLGHLREEYGLRHHFPTLPTTSWRSAAWHKQQLADMAYAGIDVVLPVYWGMENAADAWSWQGLGALAEAWRQLAAERAQPPAIGLFLDTAIVAGRDLTDAAGRDWFYAQFREYFSRIPREQWATIDGRPLSFLFTSDTTAAMNQTTFDHVYARFEAEFGVRPYIVREASWDYPILRWERGERVWDAANPIRTDGSYLWGAAMHGYVDYGNVAAVGPGYDDHLVPGRGRGTVVDRLGGRRYQSAFRQAIASGKTLLAIETWNEVHEGSGISETIEFGRQYLDLTRALTAEFKRR
jgi:hypothetical protein